MCSSRVPVRHSVRHRRLANPRDSSRTHTASAWLLERPTRSLVAVRGILRRDPSPRLYNDDMYVHAKNRSTHAKVFPGACRKSYMHVRRFLDRKPRTCTSLRRCNYAERGRLESCARDPIGFKGNEWNLYEYATSSPLHKLDPMGLATLEECWHANLRRTGLVTNPST